MTRIDGVQPVANQPLPERSSVATAALQSQAQEAVRDDYLPGWAAGATAFVQLSASIEQSGAAAGTVRDLRGSLQALAGHLKAVADLLTVMKDYPPYPLGSERGKYMIEVVGLGQLIDALDPPPSRLPPENGAWEPLARLRDPLNVAVPGLRGDEDGATLDVLIRNVQGHAERIHQRQALLQEAARQGWLAERQEGWTAGRLGPLPEFVDASQARGLSDRVREDLQTTYPGPLSQLSQRLAIQGPVLPGAL